jgi:hypothetical protein
MWRIITNQELRGLDIVADIKNKRLKWIGHVVRMDQGRTVKKIFGNKVDVRRQRGRLGLRWLEDVEKDLWELKVKRWRQKAVDRKEWASIIMEAKFFRGP